MRLSPISPLQEVAMGEYDNLTDYDEQLYALSLCVERANMEKHLFKPSLRFENTNQWSIIVYIDAANGGEAWYYFDKEGNLKNIRVYGK